MRQCSAACCRSTSDSSGSPGKARHSQLPLRSCIAWQTQLFYFNAPQEKNPNAKVISLGIGDTTEPLPKYIADAMAKAAAGLATREGYSG